MKIGPRPEKTHYRRVNSYQYRYNYSGGDGPNTRSRTAGQFTFALKVICRRIVEHGSKPSKDSRVLYFVKLYPGHHLLCQTATHRTHLAASICHMFYPIVLR